MSAGFTRPGATAVLVGALAVSTAGLSYAMRGIPIGTAYAVWTGLGAVLTVAYAMVFGGEAASWPKIVFLAGIIGCVAGLKFVDSHDKSASEAQGRG